MTERVIPEDLQVVEDGVLWHVENRGKIVKSFHKQYFSKDDAWTYVKGLRFTERIADLEQQVKTHKSWEEHYRERYGDALRRENTNLGLLAEAEQRIGELEREVERLNEGGTELLKLNALELKRLKKEIEDAHS